MKPTKIPILHLLLLLLLAFQEMISMRCEAVMCETESRRFSGACFSKKNCGAICEEEGFSNGRCKFWKCFCSKDCGGPVGHAPPNPGPPDTPEGPDPGPPDTPEGPDPGPPVTPDPATPSSSPPPVPATPASAAPPKQGPPHGAAPPPPPNGGAAQKSPPPPPPPPPRGDCERPPVVNRKTC